MGPTAERSSLPLGCRGSAGTTTTPIRWAGRPVALTSSPVARCNGLRGAVAGAVAHHQGEQPVVRPSDEGGDPDRLEQLLEAFDVQAHPVDLEERRPPPHDLERAVGAQPGQVTGRELGHLATTPQVVRAQGIAEHDVGTAVVQVADLADGNRAGGVAHAEPARPHGEPHRRGVEGRVPRRADGHPRRGLGLAVHDPQVPPLTGSPLRPVTDPLGVETAAGLGDLPQRRHRIGGSAAGREQLEGVRHAGQRGHPGRTHRAPQGWGRRRRRR